MARSATLQLPGRIHGGGKFELVSPLSLGIQESPGRQFDDGVGGKAGRESPGADIDADLSDLFMLVNIKEVERELHEEGMDGFTGHDPQAAAGRKAGSAKKPLITGGGGFRYLDTGGDFSLPGEVSNSHARGGLRLLSHLCLSCYKSLILFRICDIRRSHGALPKRFQRLCLVLGEFVQRLAV